jgi:hypothetical protein
MVQHIQIPCDSELTDRMVSASRAGDIARGLIYLVYDTSSGEIVVHVDYDTVGRPDGLVTQVTTDLGDWLHGVDDVTNNPVDVLATRQVIDDAKDTLSEVRHKVVTEPGVYTFED